MIKNVVFDLDGTLLDTSEGIIRSVRYTVEQLGYEELDYDSLLTFVGPPVQNSFKKHFGCNDEEAQKAANVFRDYYKKEALLLAKPYDGIYELCEQLKSKGIKMAVATYKREDYALKLLNHFGFDKYCNPMHGADNNNLLKKEDIIRMCLEEMDAAQEETVLIGDTDNDAKGALKAGINFIAVTYGFGFKSESDLMDFPHTGVADNPIDVLKYLR